jgi:hypothetical protein
MDDAARVRGRQSIGDLGAERDNLRPTDRPDLRFERDPIDVLHHNENEAFSLVNLVHLREIGMIQCGGGTCLAAEALT